MEMKREEQLDQELRKLIQSRDLDEPPAGFRQSVMDQIKREQQHSISIQPLFNRKQWIVMIGFMLVVVGASFFTNTEIPGQIGQFFAEGILNISVSKTLVYSLMIFSVFLFVQVYFIRNKVEQIYK